MSNLKAFCVEKKWHVVNVPSDGNCMFSSIAIQLGRHSVAEGAREVRTELVSYLRNHEQIVSITNYSTNSLRFLLYPRMIL